MLLVVFGWLCDDDGGDVSVCRFGWMVEATLAGRCSWMGEDSCGHKLGVFLLEGQADGWYILDGTFNFIRDDVCGAIPV